MGIYDRFGVIFIGRDRELEFFRVGLDLLLEFRCLVIRGEVGEERK